MMEGNPFSPVKFLFYPEKLKQLIGDDWQKVTPIGANLDATNVCNLSCVWCIFKEFRESSPDSLSFADMHRALVQALDLGCKTAFFSGGGEPLCNSKVFPKILYDATNLGMSSCLTTNGVLIDKYLEAISDNCTYVKVSLNAGSRETFKKLHGRDVWDKVWQNVESLKAIYNGVLGLDYVVHPENYREVYDFLKLASLSGVDYAGIKAVVIKGFWLDDIIVNDVKSQIKQFKDKHKDFTVFDRMARAVRRTLKSFKKCYASPLTVTVGADYKVYPCCATKGMEEFVLGDLHTESLRDIWYGERRRNVVEAINPKKCQLCKYTRANIILNEMKGTMHPEFI